MITVREFLRRHDPIVCTIGDVCCATGLSMSDALDALDELIDDGDAVVHHSPRVFGTGWSAPAQDIPAFERLLAAIDEVAANEVRLHLTPEEAIALAAAAEDAVWSITTDRPEAYAERADAHRLLATVLDGLEARAQRLDQPQESRHASV